MALRDPRSSPTPTPRSWRCARSSRACRGFPAGAGRQPGRPRPSAPDLDGVDVVLVRLLGGRRAWEEPVRRAAPAVPPAGDPAAGLRRRGRARRRADRAVDRRRARTVAQAFEYLVHGGLANLEHLLRFVADTVLHDRLRLRPAGRGARRPASGGRPTRRRRPARSSASSSTGPTSWPATPASSTTCATPSRPRGADAVAVWCYSLRPGRRRPGRGPRPAALASTPDALITTVLVVGRRRRTTAWRWDASALGRPRRAGLQAIAATTSPAEWEAGAGGLAPLDVAMRVAIPEFDGRIIGRAVLVQGGGRRRRRPSARRSPPTAPSPTGSPGSPASPSAWPGCAARRRAERRVAIVLSAYPTKRSRLGNAVALDTPASVIELLHALRDAGYRVDRIPADGDALMAELADALHLRAPRR